MSSDPLFAVVVLTALFISAWVAAAQRGFLRVWIAWTVVCLILFPSILKVRGELDPRSFAVAVILAPLAALIAWVWYYSPSRRRD